MIPNEYTGTTTQSERYQGRGLHALSSLFFIRVFFIIFFKFVFEFFVKIKKYIYIETSSTTVTEKVDVSREGWPELFKVVKTI